MNFLYQLTISLAALFILVFLYILNNLWFENENNLLPVRVIEQFKALNERVDQNEELVKELRTRINSFSKFQSMDKKLSLSEWKEPIAVLVFVCNRANALKSHLEKLIRFRKSSKDFPIIVSQDCDDITVADTVQLFSSNVHYIKHPSARSNELNIPVNYQRYTMYYKIARHYKLGLTYVFEKLNYSSVIITEDDLDISEDFFDYFRSTCSLLKHDPTLFCISAWNDNGRPYLIDVNANDLFYRSDFFPGLGWMMTKELWLEFGSKWPNGFWDDWIREPEQRRNRSCIRPEVSRTAMTLFGKIGASKGLFFNRYLKKIVLNKIPANFTKIDLAHLLKENYDTKFIDHVYSLPLITISHFKDKIINQVVSTESNQQFRIEYQSMDEFTKIAIQLEIMADTKTGVPRTSYAGIVTCFVHGFRIYIAPPALPAWQGYDVNWKSPSLTDHV